MIKKVKNNHNHKLKFSSKSSKNKKLILMAKKSCLNNNNKFRVKKANKKLQRMPNLKKVKQ